MTYGLCHCVMTSATLFLAAVRWPYALCATVGIALQAIPATPHRSLVGLWVLSISISGSTIWVRSRISWISVSRGSQDTSYLSHPESPRNGFVRNRIYLYILHIPYNPLIRTSVHIRAIRHRLIMGTGDPPLSPKRTPK